MSASPDLLPLAKTAVIVHSAEVSADDLELLEATLHAQRVNVIPHVAAEKTLPQIESYSIRRSLAKVMELAAKSEREADITLISIGAHEDAVNRTAASLSAVARTIYIAAPSFQGVSGYEYAHRLAVVANGLSILTVNAGDTSELTWSDRSTNGLISGTFPEKEAGPMPIRRMLTDSRVLGVIASHVEQPPLRRIRRLW